MRIGAVGYPNYVYNTNSVSANSLGRVSAIPDDALNSGVDYSGSDTTNPLQRGESRDFVGIVASQMAMSRLNAARILQPSQQEEQQETQAAPALDGVRAMGVEASSEVSDPMDILSAFA